MSLLAKTKLKKKKNKFMVGWKEWCALPDIRIPAIKAKIDTGAKTSAIHATNISVFSCGGKQFVKFCVDPLQDDPNVLIECVEHLIDRRLVMNSGGHKEMRYIIRTKIQLGDNLFPIDLSLTDRELLSYRMLIGREALRGRAYIDPAKSHFQGKWTMEEVAGKYSLKMP